MALFFTALLGVGSAILTYFIFTFSEESFIQETESVIDTDIAIITSMMDLNLEEEITTVLEAHRLPQQVHTYYLVLDAEGNHLYGNLSSLPPGLRLIDEGIVQVEIQPENLLPDYAPLDPTAAAKVHLLPDGGRLIVARQIGEALQSREHLRWLGLVTIGLLCVVIFTSIFLSAFVVDRINTIGRTARRIIETGDLSQRISIDSRWDDLSNLADTLNELLAKIEKLMLDVRQVSDNIAHDLRTPLARLRTRLETLEKRANQNQDLDSLVQIETLIQESDHLISTFNALLRIANIESGKQSMPESEVNLLDLLNDVEELYLPLAEEKEINLMVDLEPATCTGDRDLLFQAVANLVDNAVKFTPQGGSIELILKQEIVGARVTVIDSGSGIPEQERQKVFTRFYRGDTSRHTSGSGLGLSLVAAVVERHKGTITLSDNFPGLRVDIHFK